MTSSTRGSFAEDTSSARPSKIISKTSKAAMTRNSWLDFEMSSNSWQRGSIFRVGQPLAAEAIVLTSWRACIRAGSFSPLCWALLLFVFPELSAIFCNVCIDVSAHMSAAGWSRDGLGGGLFKTIVKASCARFRTLGLGSDASANRPATALLGLSCDAGSAHAGASWATSNDSRHPIEERRRGASASWCVRAGARLPRI